tara:strand:- start:4309 stop:5907 length:1599 start_codon:yes stop_codon:yes gene_type:complete
MGIPSYFSYIIKNYSNIILNQRQLSQNDICFCNLLMDCNSIIYDEFRKLEKDIAKNTLSNIENILINNVINTIGLYIKKISPSKTVFIAFDGVAPFSKMQQQRTRRHKGDIICKINDIIGCDEENIKWSTSNITPGTNFMNNLSNRVKKSFSNLESHFGVEKIIVSGSDDYGEGEHKMFKYIRNKNDTGNTLIYGLDSDLIMLSLFHCKQMKQFFIYRETPEFGKNLIENNEKSDYLFMDIHRLAKAILNEMNCSIDNYHRLYDYIFMCFLLGNDFLPHFPSLNLRRNGLDILLEIYKNNIGNNSSRFFINKNLQIQWRWVGFLMNELAKNERERLLDEYTARDKLSKRKWNLSDIENREFTVQNIPVIYRQKELFIAPQQQFWEHRYYNSLFSDSVNIKDITNNYLQGLEWVFKYYTCDCPDWKWSYKYSYPPLFKDLCKFFPKKQMTYFQDTNYNPFSQYLQLAYVLPMKNRCLLPEHVEKYLLENDLEYFIEKPKYEWAFCRYFWESHPILPEIPVKKLEIWDKIWSEI